MTSATSPQGRRILVAVVTGDAGVAIQRWREQHDPREARRLPPHATLCYWAPAVEPELLERQVRHALPRPIEIHLGGVQRGKNDQGTFYVELLDQEALSKALPLLYDGTYVQFPELRDWRWHVTCVRDSRGRDLEALHAAAADLDLEGSVWRFDTVVYLELRGDRYESLATWRLDAARVGDST